MKIKDLFLLIKNIRKISTIEFKKYIVGAKIFSIIIGKLSY